MGFIPKLIVSLFHVEHSYFLIFLGPHVRLVGFGLVLVSEQVEQAVCHYPKQLLLKNRLVGFGVFPYPVNRYKYVPPNPFPFRIIKGYNIGKRIMVQILFVHLQEIRIRTKNIIDRHYPTLLRINYPTNPIGKLGFVLQPEFRFVVELNHWS